MSAIDEGLAQAADVARALVGSAVELSRVVGGGRNSRIWRVRSCAGIFALKQYPPRHSDTRDRLSTEVGALQLLERHHIDRVPRVLGVDDQRGYALLSWIDGGDVVEIGNDDVDSAVRFPRRSPQSAPKSVLGFATTRGGSMPVWSRDFAPGQ